MSSLFRPQSSGGVARPGPDTKGCLQGLQDSHAKVRWAACQAIGQMCTDLAPEVQEAEHARLLPALIAVMDDFDNPRVQAHSAAAVVNFTEGGSQVWPPPPAYTTETLPGPACILLCFPLLCSGQNL